MSLPARPAWTQTERAYRWLAAIGALVFLGLFIWLALRRLPYPFELEWMEGGMVNEVRRILEGRPIYVPPTIDYIPFVYTPGYFYVGALFSKVLGVGFAPLRLLSFLSTLGFFGVMFLIVRRETGDAILGLIAVGLEAATFHISGSWFDIARSDSLFLLLFLLGVYWLRFHPSARGQAAAGLFLAAAFFAKQTALFAACPLLLWALYVNWRRGLICALIFAVLLGGISLGWDALSGGWYRYYVFELPKHHPIVKGMWWKFWVNDLGRLFPVPMLLAVAFFAIPSRERARGFYGCLALGLIGASWLIRIRAGSFDNILIPAYAMLALLAPLGLNALASTTRLRKWFSSLATAAVAIQLVVLWYPPEKELPTDADREAGQKFVDRLRQIGGDVWVPGHSYLSADFAPHAHTVAMGDVLTGGGYIKDELRSQIQDALHRQRFSGVAMDYSDSLFLGELNKRYEKAPDDLFHNRAVFYPVTGNRTRPRTLWIPQTGESTPEPLPYSHR